MTSFICVKGKSSRALSNTCGLCDVIRTWENLESCVDVGSIALADTVSGNFIVVESIFAVIAFSCGQLEVPGAMGTHRGAGLTGCRIWRSRVESTVPVVSVIALSAVSVHNSIYQISERTVVRSSIALSLCNTLRNACGSEPECSGVALVASFFSSLISESAFRTVVSS